VKEPQDYFALHRNQLVVLDEVQWLPGQFAELRSEIDLRREAGQTVGQFLVLGLAALPLIRQSSESLAGRIAYLEMQPILAQEYAGQDQSLDQLWLRGGLPSRLLAKNDCESDVVTRVFAHLFETRYSAIRYSRSSRKTAALLDNVAQGTGFGLWAKGKPVKSKRDGLALQKELREEWPE
jgi:predicted AAA+ superfamily ATPase